MATPYLPDHYRDSLELPRYTDTYSNTSTFLTTLTISPAHPPPSSYTGLTSLLPPPSIHRTATSVTNAPIPPRASSRKETMLGIAQRVFEWGCICGFGYGTYWLIFTSTPTSQGEGWSLLLAVPVIVGVMVVTAGVVGVVRAAVGVWREWWRVMSQRSGEEEGAILLRTPKEDGRGRRGGWWGDICEPGEGEDGGEGYTDSSGLLVGRVGLGMGWEEGGGGRRGSRGSRGWVGELERIEEESGEEEHDEKVGLLFWGK